MRQEKNGNGTDWQKAIDAAIIQTRLSLGDLDSNLGSAERLLGEACKNEVDLAIFPEVFSTGFPYEELPELASSYHRITERMSDLAKETDTALIFTQVVPEDGKYLNRLFAMDRKGEVIGTYDKTHLFTRAGEDRFFTPGDSLHILKIDDVRLGPLICYEVRFPELSRKLILNGADILIYPAQWPDFRTSQWRALLRARAIENQCYVMGVNGYGPHGRSFMGGMSAVYSPFGELIADVGKTEGYSTAALDPVPMREIRKKIPVLEEIRRDLYGP